MEGFKLSCNNCNQTPEIPTGLKKIIIDTTHDFLLRKFYNLINKKINHIQYNEQEDFIAIEEDFTKFILEVSKLKNLFTDLELENINITIINQNLNLSSIKNRKSLYYFLNLWDAQDLKWILDNKSIVMDFQPIIECTTKNIFGYELLAKGINKDGSILPPKTMFDKAKNTQMLFLLDKTCRIKALEFAKNKNITTKIFINYNPASIYNPEFCLLDTIHKATELNFDFSNIVFEVVESEKHVNLKHLKNIFSIYRHRGFQVALDDIGSGYSSLNMIAELKPEYIKIDKTIIKDIHKDNTKRAIIHTLVDLTKEINAFLIAEGVETEEEFATIKELGVHLAQGYLFGKPSSEPLLTLQST